jgi:hypothetical protein
MVKVNRETIKHFPWIESALILTVLGIHLYAAFSDAYNFPAQWFTRDDAYYYFKVAQNIAEGHGSTFDGINPTNGYHPLWTLICIPIFALARFDLILPLRILLLIQAGFAAASSVLIYRLIKNTLSQPIAIVAAFFWAFNPYVHQTLFEFGLETGLAAFMVVLLIHSLWRFELEWRTKRVTRGRLAGLAIVALLTLLSRLDLVFLAGLAGAWIILRGTRMRILLPLDILIAIVGVLGAFLYRLGLPGYYSYSNAAIAMMAFSIITKLPLYYYFGLYGSASLNSIFFRRILLAVSISSLVTALGMLVISNLVEGYPRVALLYDWAINLFGLILIRWLALQFARYRKARELSPQKLFADKWKQWLEETTVYFGIVGGGLGFYMLLNKLFIGSASPVSGQIKRWWGDFASRVYGGNARNPISFWGVGMHPDFDAWRPFSFFLQSITREFAAWRASFKPEPYYPGALIICILLVLGILFLNRRLALRGSVQLALPVLLTASIVQVLSYNATGYAGMKEWYWISQPIFLVLTGSLLFAILLKPLQKIPFLNFVLLMAAIIAGLGMARDFGKLIVQRMPYRVYSSDLPFMDSARFLEENTPPGAVIGMTGGGNVGYYIQGRTIVNMDGLINSPAYFEALQAGRASDYLTGIGVDYIFANPEILSGPPYRGQYRTGDVLARFGGKALMELLP